MRRYALRRSIIIIIIIITITIIIIIIIIIIIMPARMKANLNPMPNSASRWKSNLMSNVVDVFYSYSLLTVDLRRDESFTTIVCRSVDRSDRSRGP